MKYFLIKLLENEDVVLAVPTMTNSMRVELKEAANSGSPSRIHDFLMDVFSEVIAKDFLMGKERAEIRKLENITNENPSVIAHNEIKKEINSIAILIQDNKTLLRRAKDRADKDLVAQYTKIDEDFKVILEEIKSEKVKIPSNIIEKRIEISNHKKTAGRLNNEIETYFCKQFDGETRNFYKFKLALNRLIDGGFGIVALRDIKANGIYSEYSSDVMNLCIEHKIYDSGLLSRKQLEEVIENVSFDCEILPIESKLSL